MTVLNFMLADDAVHLVTDTVVSDPADMQPMTFTTKVFPVPHWQGLICGTGSQQVILQWYCTAITFIVARDTPDLDQHVPDVLRSIYLKCQEDLETEIPRTTLYHFGFDQTKGRFTGFAYRSTNGFISEQLDQCFVIKPDLGDTGLEIEQFPADFIKIAEMQKLKDEAKPLAERVGIGGHLIAYAMERSDDGAGNYSVSTTFWCCHEFPDFRLTYNKACAKLPANG